MKRTEKEHVVAELVERLRTSDTLIVADYRGLPMTELDGVRTELLKHGARFSVVKNTLTKRAAEAAGIPELNELLEGPTAIAFVAAGDMVAVAKTLNETARRTRILALRGGILQGRRMTADDVRDLANLPPADVLRGQVLGAVVGPLNAVVGLFTAPLRDFVGVIDARIRQLEEQAPAAEPASAQAPEAADDAAPVETPETAKAPGPDEGDERPPDEPQAEAPGSAEDQQTPSADATEAVEAEVESIGDEQAKEEA
jgi:large subunit ribosomal protein L10